MQRCSRWWISLSAVGSGASKPVIYKHYSVFLCEIRERSGFKQSSQLLVSAICNQVADRTNFYNENILTTLICLVVIGDSACMVFTDQNKVRYTNNNVWYLIK